MCGRFTLTTGDRQRLAERFGADMPASGGLERFNVAPTEPVLSVIRRPADAHREALLARWGLLMAAASAGRGAALINARSETVLTRRPFAALARRPDRRCLVLADGFFEWLRPEDGRAPRVPFHFRRRDGAPFAFAGLCGWSQVEDGWTASVAILTCAPNPLVARLHDRMPVMLAGPAEEAAWLADDLDENDLPGLCCPFDAEQMTVAPANPLVNRAGIPESPELLDAPAAEPVLTLF